MIHVSVGKAAYWLAVAWSAGVWSLFAADVISTRIGDTKARRLVRPTH